MPSGFERAGDDFRWTVPELNVVVDGDHAVTWGLNRMADRRPDGSEDVTWSRGTRVFQRSGGRWLMTHQHVSFPIDPTTGLAATELTPMTSTANDHAEFRRVIGDWHRAIVRGDLEGVVAAHTDDIVMFDVPAPERGVRGTAAYAATWPSFFEWLSSGTSFEVDELEVVGGDDVAFAWGAPPMWQRGRHP